MTPATLKDSGFPSNAGLREALQRYQKTLQHRQELKQATGANHDLCDLDRFVWHDLPLRIRERASDASGEDSGSDISGSQGWLESKELKEVTRWKLARGKFRPTLPGLVASNTEDQVREVTQRAFRTLHADPQEGPRGKTVSSPLAALKILCELRGVGPATASLLLSIASPSDEGFMSDESWYCLPKLAGRKVGYTEADWKRWKAEWEVRLQEWTQEEKGTRGSIDAATAARELERAMWVFQTAGGKSDASARQDDNDAAPDAPSKSKRSVPPTPAAQTRQTRSRRS
ncbi:unnamed protein product [Parajaminaea phylloscopi]